MRKGFAAIGLHNPKNGVIGAVLRAAGAFGAAMVAVTGQRYRSLPTDVTGRQPCASCPWRVGVDAWAIGRLHSFEVPPLWRSEMVEMARQQDGSFGAPVMACHLTQLSPDRGPVVGCTAGGGQT
jgi:hypothetical protein